MYSAAGGYNNLIAYLAARLILFTLAIGPVSFSLRVARFYAALLDRVLPRLRRTAIRNLELAGFPIAQRKIIADGVFQSIARLLVAFARMPRMNRDNIGEWIRYEGLQYFQQAKEQGRGVLFATAHLGNWELSAFAHGMLTEPMNIVVRPLDNPRIDDLVEKRRQLSGNTIISKREAARAILRALQKNEAVGVLIDQNTSGAEGVFVDFFGTAACANSGFVKLAARSGAAVIPGFALWEETEQRYILRFYPPVRISGRVQEDTQSLHAALESIIRQYPDQWLWIHRRWKTRPEGDAAIY